MAQGKGKGQRAESKERRVRCWEQGAEGAKAQGKGQVSDER
jgi:hypothetical protein